MRLGCGGEVGGLRSVGGEVGVCRVCVDIGWGVGVERGGEGLRGDVGVF